MQFSSLSDGTGESAVAKVDATSVSNGYKGVAPGVNLCLKDIIFNVWGGSLLLLWDASTDEAFANLSGTGRFDWKSRGGLRAPAIAGATGSILFTTQGFAPNSGYTVTLAMTKGVLQS